MATKFDLHDLKLITFLSLNGKMSIIVAWGKCFFYCSHHHSPVCILLWTQFSLLLNTQDGSYVWSCQNLKCSIKNLRQLSTFCKLIEISCSHILATSFSSSNLFFVHLSYGIPYNISESFSIYLSVYQYDSFSVDKAINGLNKNLSTLLFLVLDYVK